MRSSRPLDRRLLAARPFATIAVFIAVLLCADRALSFALSHAVLMSDQRVARMYDGRARGDVLVLGNSVAAAMTSPQRLNASTGLETYRLAVHGLDARTQLAFVRAYLRRNPAPTIAVLEVRTVSDREVRAREFAMFFRESPELVALAEAQSPTFVPWRRIFTLYNFNSRELPSVLARIVSGDDQRDPPDARVITMAHLERYRARDRRLTLNESSIDAFRETIDLLTRAGARVLVVSAPLHPVTIEGGDWIAGYNADLAARLPQSVTFMDAHAAFSEDRYFEDPTHLNDAGRDAFTALLADAIRNQD